MRTEADIRRNLATLPKDLVKAYKDIYDGILAEEGGAREISINAFRWFMCSYEPLAAETLLDAVMVKVGQSGEFSHDGPVTTNMLLKMCHNLIIFDKDLNVFRFAHLTVEEYLESKLPKVESHTCIAKTCISLLCCQTYPAKYDYNLSTSEGKYRNRHLLLYSSVFWPWHFSYCESAYGPEIVNILGDDYFQRWFTRYRSLRTSRYSTDTFWQKADALIDKNTTYDPLSVACIFGLNQTFKRLLESRAEVQSSFLQELLSNACKFGYSEIVRDLFGRGADVSAADEDGRTLLHWASDRGHEAVARLLIEKGTDVSVATQDGRTPLHGASDGGHEAVAQLLIEKGADVSAADWDGRMPLHEASDGGHEAVARLLIEKGADVSAVAEDGRTPLHWALYRGHEALARLLIEKGADVSAADEDGRKSLH